MRAFHRVLLGIALGFGLALTVSADQLALAPPPPTGTAAVTIGVPTVDPNNPNPKAPQLSFKVTVNVNGMAVPRTINIPKIDPWPFAFCKQTETVQACADRRASEWGTFSQAKAKVIADAINTAFANEFQQLGATATTETTTQFYKSIQRNVTLGVVVVPGILPDQKRPYFQEVSSTRREVGQESAQFRPGATRSSGAQGSMGRADASVVAVATGVGGLLPHGSSEVQFGIQGLFVADVTPTPGMTDADVLHALQSLLVANGISATFDPINVLLTLNTLIPDGEQLVWGNTDTGLDFQVTFGPAAPVPEPASAGLFAAGLVGLFAVGRRRLRGEKAG